jgi:hypothetical protein
MTAVATLSTGSLPFGPTAAEKADFAAQLRQQTLACRVHHEKLGVRKALTREQLRTAAAEFDADSKVLSAAKKILDTKDPAFRKVIRARTTASKYWKAVTSPYPEPGIRLIRKSAVEAFEKRMSELAAELSEGAAQLQEKYEELRSRAQQQLGTLFNPSDYPLRVDTEFSLDWDYPSIEPPAYLKNLHPELYERESKRISQQFDEAVRLTEQALAEQLHKLVSHLSERLKGDAGGKGKVFRDTAVENLTAFFESFKAIDTGSNSQLRAIVQQAQGIVAGISPDDLRGSGDLRARVASELSDVQKAMDGMMITKPTRAINLEDEDE